MTHSVAVIGAGITGLACARALADAGRDVVVFDKGRGIGGRMATRRVGDDMAFDHGAQYFRARSPAFQDVITEANAAGLVSEWPAARSDSPAWVGTPGMNGLAKHVARGLDVRQNVEITSVRRVANGWNLSHAAGEETAAHLICTVPVVQARPLLGQEPGMLDAMAQVQAHPCWALMIAFDGQINAPDWQRPDGSALAWTARNSAKSGRPEIECWVAHATSDWSRTHLEQDRSEAAERLSHAFAKLIGPLPDVLYTSAHRWRYATTQTALAEPFLRAEGLHIGGDWCLGARVEHGFESGRAVAADLLGQAP
ncbi:MAG: NAD(P)/FAD-dependent oxidoreductase [Paracoccaceae bacterium]